MSRQVYVWDKFIRVFHWSLVALFITSYLTGDEVEWLHVYSGYAIVALISLRLLWGFVGSPYARFNDFVKWPGVVFRYLKTMMAGHPKRYLGHNPAGGAMVVALLVTLLVVTLSGMKLYAVEEGKGPLAQTYTASFVHSALADDDDDDHEGYEKPEEDEEEFWEETHEIAVNLMLFLIIAHVAGVFFTSYQHRESLVKAMITGKKNDLE